MQITQLTVVQFGDATAQPAGFPGLGGFGGALNRVGGPSDPQALSQALAANPAAVAGNPQMQLLLTQGLLTQMLSLLVNLLANSLGGQQAGCPCGGTGPCCSNGLGGLNGSGASGGGASGGSSASGGASSSGGSSAAGGASAGGNVDPSTVKDKTSTSGLSAAAVEGLNQAHKFGLPLVSGKRSGSGTSDHNHGDAIDVGTLPIGAASSNGGTPEMKAFAEHMRQEGKAGRSKVKYIIRDGEIASATGNWEWRPYTYPGKSQGELQALKQSNPGEYNRLQHFDHVHVSFND